MILTAGCSTESGTGWRPSTRAERPCTSWLEERSRCRTSGERGMGFAVRRLSATAPRIYYHSSEEMPEIRDASANLVVASPPYTNCRDGKTLDKTEYLLVLSAVFQEARRVLRPGGYLVTINTDLRDHARHNGGDKTFDGRGGRKKKDIRGRFAGGGGRS